MHRLLLGSLILVLPLAAQAQDGGLLRFKEEVIRAQIQKPEVSYIYTRPDLTPRYDLELKESFLPRIEASVQQKPF